MKQSKPKQLTFQNVIDSSFRQHERKFQAYMVDNVELYRGFARMITPDLSDNLAVYTRIAFAIVSANAPFEDSIRALDVAIVKRGKVTREDMLQFSGMTPAKAIYVNELWTQVTHSFDNFRKYHLESWQEFRERLMYLKGLGRAKASFAACLLYPLEADLACVDTWIQKVFLGHTGFKSLSRTTYQLVEAKIRRYARKFQVSTFLAQWMIWDHARGGKPNSHAIFPGSHKGAL